MVVQWVVLPPHSSKASLEPGFGSEFDPEFRLLSAWSFPVFCPKTCKMNFPCYNNARCDGLVSWTVYSHLTSGIARIISGTTAIRTSIKNAFFKKYSSLFQILISGNLTYLYKCYEALNVSAIPSWNS